MSHEIRLSDRFGEVRRTGQRAWHGLGMEIAEGLTAVEAFPLIGLDWETELLPIYAEHITPEGVERIEVPDLMLHVRMDNGLPLGPVSKGYKPVDNGDLARFADSLAGADAAVTVETGGSLYDSRRVFVCVRLPEVVRATAEDELLSYVLVSNGHGGTASFACYPTSVRVVCANTLRMSEQDVSRGIRFWHTGDLDQKVAMARSALGIARRETERFQEQVTALVRTNLDESTARAFMEMAWEDCHGRLSEDLEPETLEKMTAKRDRDVAAQMALMENERNSLPGIRGTAWSALNAVTEWHDHVRSRFGGVGESNARVHSNLFGSSAKDKTKVLRRALELV